MISARRQFVFRGLGAAQGGKILCNFSVVCLNSPTLTTDTMIGRRERPDDLERVGGACQHDGVGTVSVLDDDLPNGRRRRSGGWWT